MITLSNNVFYKSQYLSVGVSGECFVHCEACEGSVDLLCKARFNFFEVIGILLGVSSAIILEGIECLGVLL